MTSTRAVDLSAYGIKRLEKVRWLYPPSPDVLSSIKSKTTRAFLRKSAQELEEYHITTTHRVVSESEYLGWLPYYEQKMTEAGYDIFATKDWYGAMIAEGITVEGIFFYQGDKLCGSIIFTTTGSEQADARFKASDHIEGLSKKRQSLGAIIDYYFLVNVTQRQFSHISMGRSRNAFGVINKVGYLDYKLRFGCIPTIEPGFPLVDVAPVNEEGSVLFFGIKKDELSLFCFTPEENPQSFDIARFHSEQTKYIQQQYPLSALADVEQPQQ